MSGIDLSSLFDDPTQSDLKVSCGTKVFNTHKVVLCTQSEYFHNACYGRFRESESNEIDLSDNDVLLVEALLRFLYRGAYDIPQPESEKLKVSPICFHAAMSTIADKYQLLKLKEYAFQRLRSVINKRECSLEELLNKGPLIFASLPAQDLGARAHIAFNVSRDYALSLSWTIDNNEKQLECAAEALHETLSAHPVFAKDVLRGLCVAIAVANDFFKRHNIVVGTSIKCAVCAGEKLRNPHDDGAPDSYWSCSDCARESFTKDWDAKIARREASDEARQAAGNVDSAIEKSENESGAKEKDLPFFYVR